MAAIITLTLLRVAITLRTFSVTVDESSHIGAGLELYQQHTYTFHRQNPPLPRVIFAAVPHWRGMRVDMANPDVYGRLLSVFFTPTGGKFEAKLVEARVGNLLFLALACVAVWVYATRTLCMDRLQPVTGGRPAKAGPYIALVLFVTQPIVLGYSGVATHDTAATATAALALIAFLRWLKLRDAKSAALLGAAYAVSILCKFSCIAFVPAACASILLVRVIDRRETLARLHTLLVAVPVVCVVIWAGYGFSVRPIAEFGEFAGSFGRPAIWLMQHVDPRAPLPAPDFFIGLANIQSDRGTFAQYLFGKISNEGWWWYFPATIVLKTPLPFLLLVLAGAFVTWRDKALRGIYLESMLAAIVMIALAANSRLDLGIRYILPAYVPMTIAAAAAVVAIPIRSVAAVLVALQILISLAIHPDYFPYFNVLAGKDPSRYLIDSNLDWGQDVLRLRSALRKMNVDHVAVFDSGLIDYKYLGFPPFVIADPKTPRTGWVAVGDHVYRMGESELGYSWLRGLDYRRIGKSIRLYHVER